MSWVKAKGYQVPQYVFDQLLLHIEADMKEANELPPEARAHTTFSVRRTKQYVARLYVHFGDDQDPADIAMFGIIADSHVVAITTFRGKTTQFKITAQYNTEEDVAEWYVEGRDFSMSVAELSQAILEPILLLGKS